MHLIIIFIMLFFLHGTACTSKQDETKVNITNEKVDPKKYYNGRTPLMGAARHGDIDLVRFHLDRGADINGIPNGSPYDSSFYATPLIYATRKGHKDVVKILLNKGADKDFMALMM